MRNLPLSFNSNSTTPEAWMAKLQNDNVIVDAKIVDLQDLTGMPAIKGKSKALVSEGRIVNIVSPNYGFLPNENFFLEVERALVEADIEYVTRSINRDNVSFAVDYILKDDRYHVDVKDKGGDVVMPMMRFSSGYDGFEPTTGSFGMFRKVCSNGLHVAKTQLGFRVKHTSGIGNIVLNNIDEMVKGFINNEYYELKRKFDVMSEAPITDLAGFVALTAEKLNLFKFQMSEKNPTEPSKNAQIVMDTITREAGELGTAPSLWLGYNAFNELLHTGKKTFGQQKQMDSRIFDFVADLAGVN